MKCSECGQTLQDQKIPVGSYVRKDGMMFMLASSSSFTCLLVSKNGLRGSEQLPQYRGRYGKPVYTLASDLRLAVGNNRELWMYPNYAVTQFRPNDPSAGSLLP